MSATYQSPAGNIFTRAGLENGIISHLEDWLIPYLAEVERAEGLDARTLALPRTYSNKRQLTNLPEETFPYVSVISPGTSATAPTREGDGSVTVYWNVAVGAMVSASTTQATRDLASYYAAAIRLSMAQHPTLGDIASGCDYTGEAYDDIPWQKQRTISTCRVTFNVEIQDVIDLYGFLGDTPPLDPYAVPPQPPTVTQVGPIDADIK